MNLLSQSYLTCKTNHGYQGNSLVDRTSEHRSPFQSAEQSRTAIRFLYKVIFHCARLHGLLLGQQQERCSAPLSGARHVGEGKKERPLARKVQGTYNSKPLF